MQYLDKTCAQQVMLAAEITHSMQSRCCRSYSQYAEVTNDMQKLLTVCRSYLKYAELMLRTVNSAASAAKALVGNAGSGSNTVVECLLKSAIALAATA